ncbi:uncharacterized protein LOC117124524 isoform X2 [Anneissia japonica]|uniref:uncharacterized protein LOC117124524 isoform X2 n=1 Tax=Anneissia japonica TaxID=1529436 RepID=UPI0014256FD1|nr:uncharacterized protein LOC117124524 isoform X2 [Anneissia japonica]
MEEVSSGIKHLVQGPIQAALRPAVWLPGIRNLHSYKEKWLCPETLSEDCVEELIEAVERIKILDPETTYRIHKVNNNLYRVQIFIYTWAECLDVVEIEFRPGRVKGTEAKCYSFSSGVLPAWVPFGFILNCMFFFVPFSDNKFNRKRIAGLREAMAMSVPCFAVSKYGGIDNMTLEEDTM